MKQTDSGKHTQSHTYLSRCNLPETDTDANNKVTTYKYDDNCNLRFVTNPVGAVTEYQYNSAGQRNKFIDPVGNTWTLQFDANRFPSSRTDPFNKTTIYQFSSTGDLQWRRDRLNRRIDFTYDKAHNLTKETWADGHVITWTYDDSSQLKTATDENSQLTFNYDPAGRVQTATTAAPDGTGAITLTYGYDVDGNLVSTQDSLGGITSYSYDALDRLMSVQQFGTSVQPKRVDMNYDKASLLQSMSRFADLGRSNAVASTTFLYECGGRGSRMTSIVHQNSKDGSPIHARNWMLDAVGNILHLDDADGSHTYTYDDAQRLLTANHIASSPTPNEFYTYDLAGNRLTSHLSSQYTYTYQTSGAGNRLVGNEQFTFQYDDEGNLISQQSKVDGTTTVFSYDFRNRLTAVSVLNSQGTVIEGEQFNYDALDRRIRMSRSEQVASFIWDGVNPILKLNTNGTVMNRRLYSLTADAILADDENAQTRWYLGDQVSTVRDLVSNSGQSIQHYVFDSFGQLIAKSNQSVPSDLLFVGREFDASGLGYLRARYYRPDLGVFLSEDRLQPFGYSYALGNPLSFVDWSGLSTSENVITRSLSAADLGLESTNVQILNATLSVDGETATVFVDMIQGNLGNPFRIISTLKDLAQAHGASVLRIGGILANERLLRILEDRWDAFADLTGVGEYITLPIK